MPSICSVKKSELPTVKFDGDWFYSIVKNISLPLNKLFIYILSTNVTVVIDIEIKRTLI